MKKTHLLAATLMFGISTTVTAGPVAPPPTLVNTLLVVGGKVLNPILGPVLQITSPFASAFVSEFASPVGFGVITTLTGGKAAAPLAPLPGLE